MSIPHSGLRPAKETRSPWEESLSTHISYLEDSSADLLLGTVMGQLSKFEVYLHVKLVSVDHNRWDPNRRSNISLYPICLFPFGEEPSFLPRACPRRGERHKHAQAPARSPSLCRRRRETGLRWPSCQQGGWTCGAGSCSCSG